MAWIGSPHEAGSRPPGPGLATYHPITRREPLGGGVVAVLRFGGASDGDLAVSVHPDDLVERRRRLHPGPWTWLNQDHGSAVVVVARPGGAAGSVADAVVTACLGAPLAVHTADCAPVLLWASGGPDGTGVVGAAHAGWRGLAAGILDRVVTAMVELGAGTPRAAIGPCISPAAYEFGATDLEALATSVGPEVVSVTSDGRPALDLAAGVVAVLARAGVACDTANAACTATNLGLYSHRERSDAGRQASLIWIEPDAGGGHVGG